MELFGIMKKMHEMEPFFNEPDKNKSIFSATQKLIEDFSAKEYAYLQFADNAETEKIQTKLLLHHLNYTIPRSCFYRKLYQERKIDLSAIKDLKDLSKLPLTDKEDIADTAGFLCVDPGQIVDLCLTSATSGSTPTLIPLTGSDLSRLAYNEELALAMAGINGTDTLIICAALDRCFMAGIAYFLGGVKLKAQMVRSGAGSASQHWELIKLTKATAIVGVPSLIYKIGQHALLNHEDPAASTVKKLIAIGEPTKDENLLLLPMAKELERMWNANIYSTYASSEIATTFCECEARSGGHLRPELNIVEILDDNGNPLSDGEKGEVVVTPLGVTGMPLIRFKTGDISYLIAENCFCGRTTKRLAPILGRKKQMLKYKGTTVFPNAILSVLEGDPRFYNGYIEVMENDDKTDRIILYAALFPGNDKGDWIRERLQAAIRVVPEIRIIDQASADKKVYNKKLKRTIFFDLR